MIKPENILYREKSGQSMYYSKISNKLYYRNYAVEYLDDFLHNINRSQIKKVVLHIRHGEITQYSDPYHNKGGSVVDAGRTNEKYVSSKLTHYKLVQALDLKTSNAWYLIYEL